MTQTLHKPYSYRVPASRFPVAIDIVDLKGDLVRRIADKPLAEDIPVSFGSTRVGPRSVNWRADTPATVFWVEAQDGGADAVSLINTINSIMRVDYDSLTMYPTTDGMHAK